MVQKADGSWWPCGDYRRLNLLTEADCYPLPNMADITSSLAGASVFSKLDLKKGYHQIPVHPAHIKKTAIIKPFGLFQFVRLPFGLKNAGMTFQRFMVSPSSWYTWTTSWWPAQTDAPMLTISAVSYSTSKSMV